MPIQSIMHWYRAIHTECYITIWSVVWQYRALHNDTERYVTIQTIAYRYGALHNAMECYMQSVMCDTYQYIMIRWSSVVQLICNLSASWVHPECNLSASGVQLEPILSVPWVHLECILSPSWVQPEWILRETSVEFQVTWYHRWHGITANVASWVTTSKTCSWILAIFYLWQKYD